MADRRVPVPRLQQDGTLSGLQRQVDSLLAVLRDLQRQIDDLGGGGSGGVTSVNGEDGAITMAAGTGMSVTTGTDTVTYACTLTGLPSGGSNGQVMTKVSGSPAWSSAIGNVGVPFAYAASDHQFTGSLSFTNAFNLVNNTGYEVISDGGSNTPSVGNGGANKLPLITSNTGAVVVHNNFQVGSNGGNISLSLRDSATGMAVCQRIAAPSTSPIGACIIQYDASAGLIAYMPSGAVRTLASPLLSCRPEATFASLGAYEFFDNLV